MSSILTTWQVCTYDVWGNAEDGYDVNDVYKQGEVELDIPINKYNEGTEHEFEAAAPTDDQIKDVFEVGGFEIQTDGDDTMIWATLEPTGYPLGHLECTSHVSLSPIRKEGAV